MSQVRCKFDYVWQEMMVSGNAGPVAARETLTFDQYRDVVKKTLNLSDCFDEHFKPNGEPKK